MSDKIQIFLTLNSGAGHILKNGFDFRFVKERYTPYTYLHVNFYNQYSSDLEFKYISLYINDKLLHFGHIDTCEYTLEKGTRIYNIYSKGFTSLLAQNQMTPGLVADISLSSLLTDYYDIPEITYEANSVAANYIYCKDGSTMWNAIENITQKLYDTYPYIRGTNCVRMSAPADAITVEPTNVLKLGKLRDYRKVVSHYHMQDIEGNYGVYNSTNSLAQDCGIVRHKEIALDRQHLDDPSISLGHKMKYCMRGYIARYVEYVGYLGEDLRDRITYSDFLENAEIGKVDISGNGKFIKTRTYAYFDRYCNT